MELRKNTEAQSFEMERDGHIAFIDYTEYPNEIALTHTESPEELAGTGTAKLLVQATLEHIEQSGKQLLPFCPYVYAFIKKNPEWKRIVSTKFPRYDKL